ncbi:MAG: hypothetical protein Q9190_005073, partial [Brigantiaea leucoxantha]
MKALSRDPLLTQKSRRAEQKRDSAGGGGLITIKPVGGAGAGVRDVELGHRLPHLLHGVAVGRAGVVHRPSEGVDAE